MQHQDSVTGTSFSHFNNITREGTILCIKVIGAKNCTQNFLYLAATPSKRPHVTSTEHVNSPSFRDDVMRADASPWRWPAGNWTLHRMLNTDSLVVALCTARHAWNRWECRIKDGRNRARETRESNTKGKELERREKSIKFWPSLYPWPPPPHRPPPPPDIGSRPGIYTIDFRCGDNPYTREQGFDSYNAPYNMPLFSGCVTTLEQMLMLETGDFRNLQCGPPCLSHRLLNAAVSTAGPIITRQYYRHYVLL